jgi:hypothetical protein
MSRSLEHSVYLETPDSESHRHQSSISHIMPDFRLRLMVVAPQSLLHGLRVCLSTCA